MKKILSKKTTAIVCLALSVLFMAFCAYVIVRPVSYAMAYHTKSTYGTETFEGTMKFFRDGTMSNRNTNYDNVEKISRYYYKDGYIFFIKAETDADYEKEVAYINENFREALDEPFYADKVSAFRLVAQEPKEDFAVTYTCTPAIVIAALCAVVEVALIGLTCTCFVFGKKAKCEQ